MTEPAWLGLARAKIGIRETPGPKNNPVIIGWAQRLGAHVLGINYADDSNTPWCGLFVAEVMTEAGFIPPPIAVRAKAWATWGHVGPAAPGAVLVFQRPGGGHVGFYVAEDDTAYHVLGGNQGDAVSITRVAKDRCVAVRWPSLAEALHYANPAVIADAGGKLSRNEA